MPSPFPGMDPYLEGSEWVSVHVELSSEIARQLAPRLRPKYIVRTMRRFVTDMPGDVTISGGDLYPDVSMAGPMNIGELPSQEVAVAPTPIQMVTAMPTQVPHVSIEIRDVAGRELVTAIEVLSPANKRGNGYREYLEKRRRILYSPTHLIEIDLLHAGQRVPMEQPFPQAPYFVIVSRAEERPNVDVWPVQLSMQLPVIAVPLASDDPDVTLDLQLAFTSVYDALSYDLSTDYSRPPEVPLSASELSWIVQHLRAANIELDSSAWPILDDTPFSAN